MPNTPILAQIIPAAARIFSPLSVQLPPWPKPELPRGGLRTPTSELPKSRAQDSAGAGSNGAAGTGAGAAAVGTIQPGESKQLPEMTDLAATVDV